MPLFNKDTDTVETPVIPTAPAVPIVGTAALYSGVTTKDSMVAYLDGNPLAVTYYSQYLGEDDVMGNANDISDPSLRQYLKIRGFELKSLEDLTPSIDQQTGLTVVTGSANVYPYITPTVGDIFIAAIEDGVSVEFEVNAVERLTIYRDTAWRIEFNMIRYVTTATLLELDGFVVNVVVFDLDLIGSSRGPLRTESEYNQDTDRAVLLHDLTSQYYEWFFSYRFNTFVRPGDHFDYDPHLIDFWNTVIQLPTEYYLDYPEHYAAQDNNGVFRRSYTTIWDVVIARRIEMLARCTKQWEIVPVSSLNTSEIYHSIRYIGFTGIVQPVQSNGLAVKSIAVDAHVLSNEFYAGDTPTDPFELLLRKYLNGDPIPYDEVAPLYTAVDTWTPLQRYHRIPLLLVLFYISR